jgi:hypothetical protein
MSIASNSSSSLALRGVQRREDRNSLLAACDDENEPPAENLRQVSFVQLFQRALTVRGIVDPSEAIPTFVDSETCVMHPRSTALRLWTLTMVVILFINAVLIPAEVTIGAAFGLRECGGRDGADDDEVAVRQSAFKKPAFDSVFVFERVLDMFFLAGKSRTVETSRVRLGLHRILAFVPVLLLCGRSRYDCAVPLGLLRPGKRAAHRHQFGDR